MVLGGFLLVSALYLSLFPRLGWIPHDEGLLGQQAVRFLRGEIPHRDFHETYSGGLTVLNALCFRALGVDSLSLRKMLFMAALFTVGAVFLFSHAGGGLATAALVGAGALTWSFPNFFAGLPSWYVVGFWIGGAFCLRRFEAGPSSLGWVFGAGIFSGLAACIKISGVFFPLAALLYFCHRAMGEADATPNDGRGVRIGNGAVAVVLMAHAAMVSFFLWKLPRGDFFLNLYLPNFALDAYLGVGLWRKPLSAAATRNFFRNTVVLAVGFAVVVLPGVLWFARHGALMDLGEGLFSRPWGRVEGAPFPFPRISYSMYGLLPALILALGLGPWDSRKDRVFGWILTAVFFPLLFVSGHLGTGKLIFYSLRLAPPFLVLLVLGFLWKNKKAEGRGPIFLGVSLLALGSLIQFPFAQQWYFYYTAPLVWLFLGTVFTSPLWKGYAAGRVTSLFYILYALLTLNHLRFSPGLLGNLGLARASLAVDADSREVYGTLIRKIQEAVPEESASIFAGPDCPEIYFLSGRRNPTKILYEVFEDSPTLEDDILREVMTRPCRAVTVNLAPEFSRPFSPHFHAVLKTLFVEEARFGHFVLYSRPAFSSGKKH
jgi:hypothetical protein